MPSLNPPPPETQSLNRPPTQAEAAQMEGDREAVQALQALVRDIADPTSHVAIFSVDLEQYEMDHRKNLEIGIAVASAQSLGKDGHTSVDSHHLINADHKHYHNRFFVPDHRQHYVFGESREVANAEIPILTTSMIEAMLLPYNKVYFVGHTIGSDQAWMGGMGIHIATPMIELDIGRAYRGLISPERYINMVGMERMLVALDISFQYLHNGGNDAVYNIQALEKLVNMVI